MFDMKLNVNQKIALKFEKEKKNSRKKKKSTIIRHKIHEKKHDYST